MHEQARKALAELGHEEIDTHIQCGKLGIGLQQMVEIAKAVSLDAKLIIMDEPTSSLGKQEVEQLMKTVRRLKEKGIAILFVSHKLEELFELCERVTVMRDGAHILTDDVAQHDPRQADSGDGRPHAGQPVSQGLWHKASASSRSSTSRRRACCTT